MPITPEKSDWYNHYTNDAGSTKFQTWLLQARDNRSFLDMDLDPLRSEGLNPDDRDWIKSTEIKRIVRNLAGRAKRNPINPRVVPHEGAYKEEAMSGICEALISHERVVARGPRGYILDNEISDWIDEGLETGLGYLDVRIDRDLSDDTYLNGKPIYESINPTSVVLDSRARRMKEQWHLHIMSQYSGEAFEATFGEKADGYFGGEQDTLLHLSRMTNELDSMGDMDFSQRTMITVIEHQFIKVERENRYQIPTGLQNELYMRLPTGWIGHEELKKHLAKLRANVPGFTGAKLEEVTATLAVREPLAWNAFATYTANGNTLLKGREFRIGKKFTLVPLWFMRIAKNSPYAWGAPYFLRDLQKFDIVIKNKLIEAALTSNRPRIHSKGAIDQETKDLINDPTENVIEHKGLSDDPRPMNEILAFENTGDVIPLLINLSGMLGDMLDGEYGTRPVQENVPPPGASGKLMDRVAVGSMVIFAAFSEGLNRAMPEAFTRVKDVAIAATPDRALVTIAAEDNPMRQQLIQSGKFRQRAAGMNAKVALDLTTDAEKNIMKSVWLEMYKVGKLPEEVFLELMEHPEPKRLAAMIKQHMMETNAAFGLGTAIMEDEQLKQYVMPIVQRYMQQKQQQTANRR